MYYGLSNTTYKSTILTTILFMLASSTVKYPNVFSPESRLASRVGKAAGRAPLDAEIHCFITMSPMFSDLDNSLNYYPSTIKWHIGILQSNQAAKPRSKQRRYLGRFSNTIRI
jgi:hypothetical protein